ncbi:MAG: hypothetical protein AAGG01_08895 [Planctomycetota bacterium]
MKLSPQPKHRTPSFAPAMAPVSTAAPRMAPARRAASLMLLTLVPLVASSCASLSVKRDTETSGTFNSSARSFTLLSYAFPRPAIQVAHENIADASLPNTQATRVTETDWGWFDWILEIISIRSARVKGTWGFNGESLGLDPGATADDGSSR